MKYKILDKAVSFFLGILVITIFLFIFEPPCLILRSNKKYLHNNNECKSCI